MADWWDSLAKARYGVGSTDKYRIALSGKVPGSQPIQSEDDLIREERRAAAYLFALNHPKLANLGVGVANKLRFWEDSSVHDAARQGLASARSQPMTLADLAGWRR